MEMLFTRLMKTARNARQKNAADVTDRNLAQEENQGRSQVVEEGRSQAMAGVRNREEGQNRDVIVVIGAMRKTGEEETRR